MKNPTRWILVLIFPLVLAACKDDETTAPMNTPTPKDPNTATKVMVDRFSAAAGNLFVRSASNGLPAANAAVNFDVEPFISQGFGPAGQIVKYYNFDVQPTAPAPIFVLFRQGEASPVAGQLNIVDVVPGDAGYNDFWRVVKVTVPTDYVANVLTSRAELAAYTMDTTNMVVNCPIVPEGSTASLRSGGGGTGLVRGWYRGQVVFYFSFEEHALTTTPAGMVPLSPIYVSFNINPGQPGGGPPSGFMTEPSSMQTHNVVATLPADANYSPLWVVNIYDNAEFNNVMNLSTAQMATILAPAAANVNCPVVDIQ